MCGFVGGSDESWWYHFNKRGYTALGEAVVALLEERALTGCAGAA